MQQNILLLYYKGGDTIKARHQMIIEDYLGKYAGTWPSEDFTRLYPGTQFSNMFAFFHEQLNRFFKIINSSRTDLEPRLRAFESRELIQLLDDIRDARDNLKKAGITITLESSYQQAVDSLPTWLKSTYGSPIPENTPPFPNEKFDPVFTDTSEVALLSNTSTTPKLKMQGEGAYAIVYSYKDPNYNKRFALKRIKKGQTQKEIERFHKEFEILKSLRFPYIVEVYHFDSERNQYSMEFCDTTLNGYLSKHNNRIGANWRKRVALQFLYGMNFLHSKGILHRDLSPHNILLKTYELGAVQVKLSDFGLAKQQESDFTQTDSKIRGTIIDPALESFKHYSLTNEIYAVGIILWFIFSGRKSNPPSGSTEIEQIIRKCIDDNPSKRYASIQEIITAVEALGLQ